MTLHAIAGSRDTNEFKRIEQAIEHRASGAAIFNVAAKPNAPANKGPSM
ncbi:MAG: hypothetical protein K0R10_2837 [Alphaproteobacteria bacterium]|jgi:hypothetical protein|nr:hypothetical protein [Alphaproteobacteria bacterium]